MGCSQQVSVQRVPRAGAAGGGVPLRPAAPSPSHLLLDVVVELKFGLVGQPHGSVLQLPAKKKAANEPPHLFCLACKQPFAWGHCGSPAGSQSHGEGWQLVFFCLEGKARMGGQRRGKGRFVSRLPLPAPPRSEGSGRSPFSRSAQGLHSGQPWAQGPALSKGQASHQTRPGCRLRPEQPAEVCTAPGPPPSMHRKVCRLLVMATGHSSWPRTAAEGLERGCHPGPHPKSLPFPASLGKWWGLNWFLNSLLAGRKCPGGGQEGALVIHRLGRCRFHSP